MSNFNFELNLNKHPKNCKPRSLVWAENVQVSDDGSCLQSEFDITNCAALSSFSGRKIIGQIACNNEVIFFVQNRNNYLAFPLTMGIVFLFLALANLYFNIIRAKGLLKDQTLKA